MAQTKEISYSLYVLNKAGSLLFQRDFAPVPRLSDDEYIFLGATFHSLHALSSNDVGPSGHVASAVRPTSVAMASSSAIAPLVPPAAGSVGPEAAADTSSSSSSSAMSAAAAAAGSAGGAGGAAIDKMSIEPMAGITSIDARDFRLHCHQTLTGMKFVMIGSPGNTSLEATLKHINLLYVEYVVKNPFYKMDMPIRCELFDQALAKYMSSKQ